MKRSREDSSDDEDDGGGGEETKKKVKITSGVLRVGVFTHKYNQFKIEDKFKAEKKLFKAMTGINMDQQAYELVYVPNVKAESRLDAFKETILPGPGVGPGEQVDIILFDLTLAEAVLGYDQLELYRANPELASPGNSPENMINQLLKFNMDHALMLTYICMMPAWKDRIVVYDVVKRYSPKNFQVDKKTKTVSVMSPTRQVTESVSVPVYAADVQEKPPEEFRHSALDMQRLYANGLASAKRVVLGGQEMFEFSYTDKAMDAIKLASMKHVLQWLYEWHPETKRETKVAMKQAFNYDERLAGDRFNPITYKKEKMSNMPDAIEDLVASYLGKLKLASDTPQKKRQKLLLVDSSSDSDSD